MPKHTHTHEAQKVASPNPSAGSEGKPPEDGVPDRVQGTAGTAGGTTAAGTPAKKTTTKSRTKRRRGGT